MLESKYEKFGFALFIGIIILFITFAMTTDAKAETYQWSKGYTANCDDTIARVGYDPNDPDTFDLLLDPTNNPGDAIDHVMYYVTQDSGPDITNPDITVKMIGGCIATHINTKVLSPGITYYKHAVTHLVPGLSSVSAVSEPGKPFDVVKPNPKSASNVR